MKKSSFDTRMKMLQDLLNEISTLGKDQEGRFLICKKRAARIIRGIKRDFPNKDKIVIPKPEEPAGAVFPPALGA